MLAADGLLDAQAAADFLHDDLSCQFSPHHSACGEKNGFRLEPMPTTYRSQRSEYLRLAADLQKIQEKEGTRLWKKCRQLCVFPE
jgi:hypothetical protein